MSGLVWNGKLTTVARIGLLSATPRFLRFFGIAFGRFAFGWIVWTTRPDLEDRPAHD